jgi:hypothetical protein
MGVFNSAFRFLSPARIKRVFRRPARRSELQSFGSAAALLSAGHGVVSMDELERRAAQIPSMGGKEIGTFLRAAAREASPNSVIVEVGSWLGAGTAQLALGVRERKGNGTVRIQCYDRWVATKQEVVKAASNGVPNLHAGQDTLPWVMDTLRPFDVPISFVKGDLEDATWDGEPISIYLDDAAKIPKKFYHVLRTFGPAWVPGVTRLILMDYHYWKKTGVAEHRCQTNFVENYREHFEPVVEFRRGSNAAFVYAKRMDFSEVPYRALIQGAGG